MDLYDLMKNIRGIDKEKIIKATIKEVKEHFKGLTTERTCKIYNGYLLKALNNYHLPARLINTSSLGFNYEHEFILIPYEESYFIADLTFLQFKNNNEIYKDLINNGYQLINNNIINNYLKLITKEEIKEYSIDDIYYSSDVKINGRTK